MSLIASEIPACPRMCSGHIGYIDFVENHVDTLTHIGVTLRRTSPQ